MMKLIGQYDSPFVRRVAVALQIYGLTYEHLPWSTFGEGDKIAKFSPLMRVPVLVPDEGEALPESGAALLYLDELAGEDKALIAPHGPARQAQLRLISLATGMADKAVSLFYSGLFHEGQSAMFVERHRQQMNAALAELEAKAAARPAPWWFGEVPGHADIAAACVIRFIAEAHAGLLNLKQCPAMRDHCARAEAMPAFHAVTQPFIPPR